MSAKSIGDQPITVESDGQKLGMTYRMWLIGMVLANHDNAPVNGKFDRSIAHSRAKMTLAITDEVLKILDEEILTGKKAG